MRVAQENPKLEMESSSAAALAPLLRRETVLVGAVVTGGTVDMDSFAQSLTHT